MAQTKTVVTQNGEKVTISTGANNGLTSNGGFIQLGGTLTKPSVLTTTSALTLAVQGLQAGTVSDNVLVTDANGVLKYVPRTSFTGADNLGNHIATKALEMSTFDINNVGKIAFPFVNGNKLLFLGDANGARIEHMNGRSLKMVSGAQGGTAAVGFGQFLWSNYSGTDATETQLMMLNASGNLGIGTTNPTGKLDVAGKTVTQSAQIAKGSDGASPAAGSVAVAADTNGNVKWVPASSIGAGDNLGNHTATTDLAMSGKNINNAANVTATGTIAAANVTASTKATVQTAQITKGSDGASPAAGSVAVAADTNGNVKWVPASSIGAGDNLGNHTATTDLAMSGKNINNAANVTATSTVAAANVTASTKATVQTAQITKGTNGTSPSQGDVATSADTNGNVIWTKPQDFGNVIYNSTTVAPGASYVFNLQIDPSYSNFMITSSNRCTIPMILNIATYGNGMAFVGGSAGKDIYTATSIGGYARSFKFTASTLGCEDGGNSTEFNVTVSKDSGKLTIINNGNIPRTYQVRQKIN